MTLQRPAWLEIDLNAIAHNIGVVRRMVGPSTAVAAVVKAEGYGHGLVEAGQAALRGGAKMLAVALLEEAFALREAGVVAPVLVMGPVLPEAAEAVAECSVHQVISTAELARALSCAAVALGVEIPVHLKVDTGMSRIGCDPEEAGALACEVSRLPGLRLAGLCSHLATGAEDPESVHCQLAKFRAAEDAVRDAGVAVPTRHIACSGAAAFCPEARLDMVRVGLLTYGLPAGGSACPAGLRPAMALKARLTQVRRVKRGATVSYGRTHVLARDSVLGIVPLGYADGYPRELSGKGRVLVRSRWAPVLGRVCMDQFVVDLTDVPGAAVGDEVVIIGSQGELSQTVDDLAAQAGTIAHVIVAGMSARLPRQYLGA
jgi:alanine racemase